MNTETTIGQEITPDKYVNVMPCMRKWAMARGITPAYRGNAGQKVIDYDQSLTQSYRQAQLI